MTNSFNEKEIGERIFQLSCRITPLDNRVLSCSQLAERLGITRQTLNKIFKGDSISSIKVLHKLSMIYNVSVNYILYGVDDTPDEVSQDIKKVKNIKNRKLLKEIISLFIEYNL